VYGIDNIRGLTEIYLLPYTGAISRAYFPGRAIAFSPAGDRTLIFWRSHLGTSSRGTAVVTFFIFTDNLLMPCPYIFDGDRIFCGRAIAITLLYWQYKPEH